ncbi:MAG: BrnA antitoxin family protein [Bauldia sp.]|nr:BrnA antitoxin family protein [Bauldia sp.]
MSDRVEDRDNPEWTEEMFRRAKPAREMFPGVDFPRPKRGPQKAPTKVQTTIRLDPSVIAHFREGGPGWQSRLNDELLKVVAKARRKVG